jgi:hypothetical protein
MPPMQTRHLSFLSALALAAFGLLALASNSSDQKGAAASGDPSGATPASGSQPVLASCNQKALGECTENYGMVPTMAEDMCKGEGGTFTKGATPCATEGVTGKCEFKAKAAGEPGETHFYYSNAVGDPKGSCEALGAAWTAMGGAAPKGTGSAAAPAKK